MVQKEISYIPIDISTKKQLKSIKIKIQKHIGRKISFNDVVVSLLHGG